MQNLNNIKSLNEIQIEQELNSIVLFFTNNKFGSSYINEFKNVCNKLLLIENNKTIDIKDVNEFEKAVLIEFESFLNIKYMNRG